MIVSTCVELSLPTKKFWSSSEYMSIIQLGVEPMYWKSAKPQARVCQMVERPMWPCRWLYRDMDRVERRISILAFWKHLLPFPTGYEPGQSSASVSPRLSPPLFSKTTPRVDLLLWVTQEAANATSKSLIGVHFWLIFKGQHQTFRS